MALCAALPAAAQTVPHYAVTLSGGKATTPAYASYPASTVDYQSVGPSYGGRATANYTAGAINTKTATCTGQITASFIWDNSSDPSVPAPKSIVIVEHCRATWTGQVDNATVTVSGDCFNGLGGPKNPYTDNAGGTGEISESTTYQVKGGDSFQVADCSPTASVTSVVHQTAPSYGGTDTVTVGYDVNCFPVTIALTGTTRDTDGTYKVLAGQQISATLNAPYPVKRDANGKEIYSWSVTGSIVKGYDTSKTNNDQLIPITPTDRKQPQFVFYTKNPEKVTVNCAATLIAPDNTELPVTATKDIQSLKPTVNKWVIDTGSVHYYSPQDAYGLYAALGTGYPGGKYWHDVTVNMPTPFSGGSCCFTQIYTPDKEFYPNSTTPVPQGVNNGKPGLDNSFEFDNYSWSPSQTSTGTSDDSPAFHISSTLTGQPGYKITINDSIQTWLMYMPPGSTSIWVPLQSYTWHWSATIEWLAANNNWAVTSANPAPTDPEPQYNGTTNNTFPTWNLIQTNTH